MRVIPTFYIKTQKTKEEIISIFMDNIQDTNKELSFQKQCKTNNKKFFLGDITGDEFFLRRNEVWHDEIGVKIIDNHVDRTIQYQLGAGNLLRIIGVLCIVVPVGIGAILEKALNNTLMPMYDIFILSAIIFLIVFATFQRTKAERIIKCKMKSLFEG